MVEAINLWTFSLFDYKIICFHIVSMTLYFERQSGTSSNKSNGKDNEIDYNLVIISKHLKLIGLIAAVTTGKT